MKKQMYISLLSFLFLWIFSCHSNAKNRPDSYNSINAPSTIKVTSPDFKPNGMIPSKFTCEGSNIAPAIEWSNIPAGTKSFALIVDDPDAPDPAHPTMVWVHWVVYNIPANIHKIPRGAKLPKGALPGINDFKTTTYGGPCPPIGTHRYFFKVYALDTKLPDLHNPTKDQLLKHLKGHVLAKGYLIGLYKKSR